MPQSYCLSAPHPCGADFLFMEIILKTFGRFGNSLYFCSMVEQEMKREMGKWLMDVAKLLTIKI